MPAGRRHKWRRGRVPETSKRHRAGDDDDDDEDYGDDNDNDNNNDDLDEDEDEDEDLDPNPNPNPKLQIRAHHNRNSPRPQIVSGAKIRISSFPPAVKCSITSVKNRDLVNVVLENVSYGQLQVLSSVPSDSPSLVGSDQGAGTSFVVTPPPLMDGAGVAKNLWDGGVLLVPLHADWFHPSTVHRLERQVVPHFFTSKSPQHTPDKYLTCRNFIIAKYIEYPLKRLMLGDCQKLATGGIDNEDISRIFRFLDHWGIINFSAPVAPHHSGAGDSYFKEEPTGEVHVPSASLKSIDSLIKFDRPKCKLKPDDVPSSFSSNNDHLADLDSRIRERLSENHCNYCARPLLVVYYQSSKEADTSICPDCYHEGRLIVGHSSIDFIKVDSASDYGDQDGDSWTDQETLLLLEALEIYNDNWNDIADHVGTKSKSQCILHFLRLPTEDGLLENMKVPSSYSHSNGSNTTENGRMCANTNAPHVQDYESENRFPFATSENPVMALVAFLASAVGPRIAAACAHACLAALSLDEEPFKNNRVDSDEKPSELWTCGQQKEENLGAQGSLLPNNTNEEASPIPCERLDSAAKTGIVAAAVKAKLFADHEEREIQRLSAIVVNHQLKRLELKLKQFAEVETLLMKECEQVEKTRQTLAGERTRALAGRCGPIGPMNLPGVAPQVVNNNINCRPAALSASPSQPSISVYGGSQMSHPQMPFLTHQQQMFSFGPRLPLSAIHPSSSGSPSIMFGAQGSNQSSLNHPTLRPVSGTSTGMG